MQTSQLSRGRLIDHLHLVVQDLPASRRFYQAVLDVLGIPVGGEGDGFFWADELFVSDRATVAQGVLTGRHHLAFQARDVAMVQAFHQAALVHGVATMVRPACAPITGTTTPRSCSIRTATTSKRSSMVLRNAVQMRCTSHSDAQVS